MLKKIKALTKIFIKDFCQSTNIVDKNKGKLNKKSIYFWILVLLLGVLIYISYKGIDFFISVGSPETFINIYFVLLIILLMFQVTVICTNVLFFSRDLEFILPLPISSKELLIAKINTILAMTYLTEIVFSIPLILYGFLNYTNFFYFMWLILVLLLLPIIFVISIGFCVIILMKMFSFIKNKNVLQNIISFILIMVLLIIESSSIGSFDSLREPNFLIKSISYILTGTDLVEKIKNISSLLIIDILSAVIFVFLVQKSYLKIVLKSLTATKRKWSLSHKKKNVIKTRKNKIGLDYIKKEIKMLFKQPIFFMQTIFPVIMILVSIIIIANLLIPTMDSVIQSDETIRESFASMDFNTEMICVILGILQCVFSLSNLSLTAISREGKSAIFVKYIPISYYKQFLYKNVLQVALNIIVSIIVLSVIYIYVSKIGLVNIILIFIISIFINLINSYLMLIVDLKRPYLNWNSEHSVLKRNDNKSFQYALTIIMILIYLYLSNIFKDVNVRLTLVIEIFIFMILFLIIDRIVKKKSKTLFDRIF